MKIACHSMMLCTAILCLTHCKSLSTSSSSACKLNLRDALEDYEYVKNGDIIIGGLLSLNMNMELLTGKDNRVFMSCAGPLLSNYRNFLDFRFAIDEINRDPNILPNVTLGYHIYDSCSHVIKAAKSVLQILSGPGNTIPNYFCSGKGTIAGFIGDSLSETTMPIAQILNVYGYSQISYGATDPLLRDRHVFPYLFNTAPNDHIYFSAILKLLKQFSWSWVGIVTIADDSGNRESNILSELLNSQGICVEFRVDIAYHTPSYGLTDIMKKIMTNKKNRQTILKSSANIIIVCGPVSLYMADILQLPDEVLNKKTFIFSPAWFNNHEIQESYFKVFNCSLGFAHQLDFGVQNIVHTYLINSFGTMEILTFLDTVHPTNYPEDKFLEDIWLLRFNCLSQNKAKNMFFEHFYGKNLRNCSGNESIAHALYFTSYPAVYNALRIMFLALDDLHISAKKQQSENNIYKPVYTNKLHKYLKNLHYEDDTGKKWYFNEKGDLKSKYMIFTWRKAIRNKHECHPVGFFNPWKQPDKQFLFHLNWMNWKTGTHVVKSECSESCPPGTRKIKNNLKPVCCYDCVLCSEGEISNITDSENCIKCQDIEWSNDKKNRCVPKPEEYLDCADGLSIALSSVSIMFWIISILILGIFVAYQNTPIVKANNRILSFILLASISNCFLCTFLFIGCPTDTSCMFRQIVFGIIFSIAVSSVLAKTIMVCIAFKASRPGSTWRRLIEIKFSNYIVLVASSIEIIISIIWLSTSPPFMELDTHSYQNKIIIQCNEGSVIGFYAILFYLGFLAIISFIVAYFGRTLPDRFNEAKFITFSMLVFCSVWIAMIPAYLSTKGKDMVAVEVFSIVASSAGLLGCIFFPKCYIILLKPQMNAKSKTSKHKTLKRKL